ncbi:hypothetical protein RIVM261_078680 [Rivularia sp. IAM M-261]|nr:hypothetical protein RIVM261_078680 [Rivularia sp. IAM M-261]
MNTLNTAWTIELPHSNFGATAVGTNIILTSRTECRVIDSNGNDIWRFIPENSDDWGIVKAFALHTYLVYQINRHLHFLEPKTGQLITKVQIPPGSYTKAINDDVVFAKSPDFHNLGCFGLASVNGVQWQHQVEARSVKIPTVINQTIIVGDDHKTFGINLQGDKLWSVESNTHIRGGTQLIVGKNYILSNDCLIDVSSGNYVDFAFCVDSKIQKPLTGLPFNAILFVSPIEQEHSGGTPTYVLRLMNLDKEELWQFSIHTKISGTYSTQNKLYLIFDYDDDYWEKYHRWYSLQCQIHRYNFNGEIECIWDAGAPMHGIAISSEDTIYAVSDSKLWCLK